MLPELEAIIDQAKHTEYLYWKKDIQKVSWTNEQLREMDIEFFKSLNKLNEMKEAFLSKYNSVEVKR